MNQNADPAELGRFNALARDWWAPDGPMGPLHAITPLRLDYIQATRPLKGLRVADIGCGGGIVAEAMCRAGAKVTAIDLSSELLGAAQLHAEDGGLDIDFRETSAEALAQAMPGRFDLVTCLEMLEHVPEPSSIVAACRTLVKPDGEVLFSTINRNPKAFALAIVGAEYVLRWLPRGTHDWHKFITPGELEAMNAKAGLDIAASTGVSFNPLSDRWSLSGDMGVNYMMVAKPGDAAAAV